MVGQKRNKKNPREFVLPLRFTNANILEFNHFQIPDEGRPPDMQCLVHHRLNELFIKQNTVTDEQSTSMKGAHEFTQSRGSLVDGLI